jgi:hypothetical protein
MAFLDFLTGKMKCPSCGTRGASKTGVGYRCPNPSCQWFDPALGQKQPVRTRRNPSTGEPLAPKKAAASSFAPARTIAISYRNSKGEVKSFNADPDSVERKNNHLTVRIAPTGARIVLSRERVQNLREVENAFPQRIAPGQAPPTPRERQVLGYHKKYKTTSPLYEKIRVKYPHW